MIPEEDWICYKCKGEAIQAINQGKERNLRTRRVTRNTPGNSQEVFFDEEYKHTERAIRNRNGRQLGRNSKETKRNIIDDFIEADDENNYDEDIQEEDEELDLDDNMEDSVEKSDIRTRLRNRPKTNINLKPTNSRISRKRSFIK
jgi:hypothetical protein